MSREEALEKYLESQNIPFAGALAAVVILILKKMKEGKI